MSLPYIRMRRVLSEPVPAPAWPAGVATVPFATSDVPELHSLLLLAYGERSEIPGPKLWWQNLSTDEEFDPGLCFVAKNQAGQIVGFAQCWTGGFVKDLVVHPDARRLGIGTALLNKLFATFAARGVGHVDLKVEIDNFDAQLLYTLAGMIIVPA